MRVLMLSTPVATHFTPMVPLAWALRVAGHEVLVAGQPDVTAVAQSAGLCTSTIGDPFSAIEFLSIRYPEDKRPLQVTGIPTKETMAEHGKVWVVHADIHLKSYLELASSWLPDLIVSEQYECAGPVLAAVLGIPAVTHRWGVDPLGEPTRQAAEELLTGTCHDLGLPALPEPDVILDPCPPALQVPEAKPGAPIRYVPFNGAADVPAWASKPRTTVHRVCVSLGTATLALNGLPLLRGIISAFDGLEDVEAIVTVEPKYQDALGDIPGQVRLVSPTPLDLFLHSCDAMLHHGGASTTLAAIRAGLPQVILPQVLSMFATGEAVATGGAGIAIADPDQQEDPATIRKAVLAVLEDPGYRTAAAGLQDAMSAMPGPAQVVTDLETLAGKNP